VRCLAAKPPATWASAQQWFEQAVLALDAGNVAAGPGTAGLAGRLTAWTLEACVAGAPLSPIAYGDSSGSHSLRSLPAGSLAAMEKAHIAVVLDQNRWNISRSAEILQIDRVTLYNKIEKYCLKKPTAG
jgi:transcriptional regulator of acetoin/glycerol metabolism